MPTYERAPIDIHKLAQSILRKFDSHEPVVRAGVSFDFIFALPSMNDDGQPTGDAIRKNGIKALGLCRILGLKDRAMGRGDAEILIDKPWWEDASDEEREALLDHELHHVEVKIQNGVVLRDDLHRPMLRIRKHDVEFGWFDIIALRHGGNSQERIQAKKLYDGCGQLYWPEVAGEPSRELMNSVAGVGDHVRRFSKIIEDMGAQVTISGPGMEPITIGETK